MSHPRLETIKTIFTSKYWLMVSLCGAFFSFFALNRGGVVVFIDACFVFLILNFFLKKYRISSIPLSFWITLGISCYLLAVSTIFYPETSNYRQMGYLVRMLGLVFAIHCLNNKKIRTRAFILFLALVSMAVFWHSISYYHFKGWYGTFTNPHYLSSFLVLALPSLIYYVIAVGGWHRICFVPAILADIDLLLRIESRPAIFALFVSIIFFLVFLTRGWRRWGSLLLLFTILFILYLTDYGRVSTRFEELIVNFMQEERLALWRASWNMLKDNSLLTWIVGNGVGGGRSVIPQYLTGVNMKTLTFSHNYLFELCYENGIIGVLLVAAGIAYLLVYATKAAWQIDNKNVSYFIKSMIVTFLCWLIHTGLTFPFYSKYTQYSLGFILGTLLTAMEYGTGQKTKAGIQKSSDI